MKKIAFVVDGGTTNFPEIKNNEDCYTINFKYNNSLGQEFSDNCHDINYEKINNDFLNGIIYNTSATPIGEIIVLVEELLEKYESIIFLPMNKCLSSQFNNIKILEDDYPGRIYVVDTATQAYGIENILLKSIEMAKEGQSVQDIVNFASNHHNLTKTFFSCESWKAFAKSGRGKKIITKFLDKTNFRPLLSLSESIGLVSLVGSFEKAVESALKKIKSILEDKLDNIKSIAIYESLLSKEKINKIYDLIHQKLKFPKEKIILRRTPLVVFNYTSKDSFGLWFEKKE